MAENLVVNGVTYNGVDSVVMQNANGRAVGFYPDAVRYSEQELTEAQKAQARANIGAISEIDKNNIVSEIIDLLGGTPIFGTVDAQNNIILTGKLADGVYTFKYEDAKGNQTDIGSVTFAKYINQIPLSKDTDGSIFNGTGYKASARLNSVCEVADITNNPTNPAFVTGFISIKQGDVIRLKNCYIDTKNYDSTTIYGNKTWGLALGLFDSSFAMLERCYWSEISAGNKIAAVIGSDNLTTEFTVASANTNIAYIRLTLAGTPETAIVTVNEEIE